MADTLPAITLTNVNNVDSEPTPAFSPSKDAPPPSLDAMLKEQAERPVTPTKRSSTRAISKPDSSPSRSSPSRSSTSRLRTSRSKDAKNTDAGAQEQGNDRQEDRPTSPAGIDPLSEELLARTNTQFAPSSTRPRSSDNAPSTDEKGSTEKSTAPAVRQPFQRTDSVDSTAHKDPKKGIKVVSFMSKLRRNKKKDDQHMPAEDESVSGEGRPEGNDAEVFAQSVDNISFSPSQPQPPAYIKMRSKYKKEREFDHVFLAQELYCRKDRKAQRQNSSSKLRRKSSAPTEANTVWAMEFSKDGKYLAAAGVDSIVRVWAVISSPEDRQKHETQEASESEANGGDAHSKHCNAPVFQRQPIREFEGHTSTVLDLSWSKNNFLLSSSMDKTVRLWHVSRSGTLCTFKHNDFVPSISFHPKDDRFFLAGSLDSKLRLWSIHEKRVAFAAQLPDLITAVAFTPDGKYAIAGCLGGACLFYEAEGMKYQSQLQVRAKSGNNAKGCKITGIQAYEDARRDTKLLITSNDSRIRLYNLRDMNLELKLRGNENNYSQIRASISDDGKYVVCGSEDNKAYIWSMSPVEADKRDKRPVEMFEAHDTITTAVCFAPTQTRFLLGRSEDPLYDICNPPPVTLLSREERAHSRAGSTTSSRPASGNGSVQGSPKDREGSFQKPRESASYLTRSSHKTGNIILAADYTGCIKIFRQDCAWAKRRPDDSDRSSIFSKRTGRMSRTASRSVMTRTSQPSLREGRTSTSLSGPSDRIFSWQQGMTSSPSLNEARRRSSNNYSPTASTRRSIEQKADDPPTKSGAPNISHGLAKADSKTDSTRARSTTTNGSRTGDSAVQDANPLMLQGGGSFVYWNTEQWKARAERAQKMHEESEKQQQLYPIASREEGDPNHLSVRPTMTRGATSVSQLSDERSSGTDGEEEYGDAREQNEKQDQMKCSNCGSLSFKAVKRKTVGTRLVCSRCGEKA